MDLYIVSQSVSQSFIQLVICQSVEYVNKESANKLYVRRKKLVVKSISQVGLTVGQKKKINTKELSNLSIESY